MKFGVNTQISTSNETLVSGDVGGAATTGLSITLAPTIPVYDANDEFAGPLGAGYSDRNNPLLMQYLNRWDNATKNNFFGNVFAEINILDNLTFRSSLGLDFSDFKKKNIELALLHCVSSYPNKDINSYLANIEFLKDKFKCPIGISDHTNDIKVPIYGNLLGAKIIEKHLKINIKQK